MKALPPERHVLRSWVRVAFGGAMGEFLHWHGIKKFERATMTRIGRYQLRFPDFTGNASYRRDNLAPLKVS
jgi:hypothetical protein